MKYIKDDAITDADSGEDAQAATALLAARVAELEQEIVQLPPGFDPLDKAELQVEMAGLLVDLGRNEEAFDAARRAFEVYAAAEAWQGAALACHRMYLADQPESITALGQGIWLGVTFPDVEPELTVAMLQSVVDETPPDSDGAAVAAAVAHYVADLRTTGRAHEELTFFTNQLLGTVARRHGNVDSQDAFDMWIKRLELNEPEKFLVRMRNVIDVMVQDEWWIDREAIWAKLPVN